MNRIIKFRGLCISGKKWYYGNLSILKEKIDHLEPGSYISNKVGLPFAYQVRPETVGQYTGLNINNEEIYEGDLISGIYGEQGDSTKKEIIGQVAFESYEFRAYFLYICERKSLSKIDGNNSILWCCDGGIMGRKYYYEIRNLKKIGNVYENSDLLYES